MTSGRSTQLLRLSWSYGSTRDKAHWLVVAPPSSLGPIVASFIFTSNLALGRLCACHKLDHFSLFQNQGNWLDPHVASQFAFPHLFSSCVIHLSANGLVGKSCFPDMIRLSVAWLIELSGLAILAPASWLFYSTRLSAMHCCIESGLVPTHKLGRRECTRDWHKSVTMLSVTARLHLDMVWPLASLHDSTSYTWWHMSSGRSSHGWKANVYRPGWGLSWTNNSIGTMSRRIDLSTWASTQPYAATSWTGYC